MSKAAVEAKKKKTAEPATTPESVPVAQIQVTVYVLNEYGSPVPAHQQMFNNDATATAVQHMIGWAASAFLNPATEEPAAA